MALSKDKPIRVLAVCGAGMGTCTFIKANVQNALKQHGIQAIVDVEVAANINSATINRCDAIFTSKNIGGKTGPYCRRKKSTGHRHAQYHVEAGIQ